MIRNDFILVKSKDAERQEDSYSEIIESLSYIQRVVLDEDGLWLDFVGR